MSEDGNFEEYKCEQEDLFTKLILDPVWFCDFIEYQYTQICFAKSALRPRLSRYNLMEAFDSFKPDIKDLEERENRGQPAEQFKQAAWLAYWLRRASPIQSILASVASLPSVENASQLQDVLLRYGNEYCAFDLGFRCSRYIASRSLFALGRRVVVIKDNGPGEDAEIVHEDLRSYTLKQAFIIDACQMLKEKNVSPHSLYLVYKGLFTLLER